MDVGCNRYEYIISMGILSIGSKYSEYQFICEDRHFILHMYMNVEFYTIL